MPKAVKLKSGSWRIRAFSHYERVEQEDGTTGKKGIYESFTSDDPTNKGKRAVEAAAAEYYLKKNRERRGVITLREAMNKYIESKANVLSPNTVDEYKRLAKDAYPAIVGFQTRSLNQEIIQIWTNEYSVGRSPKTVRNAHGFLTAVLSIYEPGLALKTRLPAPIEPKLYIPYDEDVKTLLKLVEGTELEKVVLLAAFGTLRRSEMCALTDEDITGNRIEIRRAMIKSGKGWVVRESPKTSAGYRTVEYPSFVIERFAGIEGRLIDIPNPNALSNRFSKLMKKSGLPRFRLHDLRHYSASIMHALKIPDQYVVERGGWKTDYVMKRIYRHSLPDKQKEFTDITNNHFETLVKKHDTKHDTKK